MAQAGNAVEEVPAGAGTFGRSVDDPQSDQACRTSIRSTDTYPTGSSAEIEIQARKTD